MGTCHDGSTYRKCRPFSSRIKAAIKDNELADRQPILLLITSALKQPDKYVPPSVYRRIRRGNSKFWVSDRVRERARRGPATPEAGHVNPLGKGLLSARDAYAIKG